MPVDYSPMKIEGEISEEPRAIAHFEFKVQNFFSLRGQVDHHFPSPVFSFLDATWYLDIYPFGDTRNESADWLGLYLNKRSSVNPKQVVTYKLGIKKADGTEYDSFSFVRNFDKNGSGWGIARFVERFSLLKDKMQIANHGTVTFFCTLYANGNPRKEKSVQTEYPDGFEKLQENLASLVDAEDGDVVLKLKNKEFRAHKPILGVRSSVFKSIFSQDGEKGEIDTVEIPNYDPEIFRDFLLYVYSGRVEEFSESRAYDLFVIADKYNVQDLRAKSLELMINNMPLEMFFDVLKLSVECNEPKLVKHVTNFFKNHTLEIIESDKWLSFSKEYPAEANDLYIKAYKNKVCE